MSSRSFLLGDLVWAVFACLVWQSQLSGQVIDFSSLPRPPIAGFSPLVAVSVSDERNDPGEEFEWSHKLESGYKGNFLTGANPATTYSIGVLDTGASVDLIGRRDVDKFGVKGDYLTSSFSTIIGASGEVNVPISQPIGVFAQGLSAIDSQGHLDTRQLVGHSNVSTVVLSPESTDPELDIIPSVIGIPMLAFYTSIIRNDQKRTVMIDGSEVTSPDVRIVPHGDPSIPELQHSIPMNFGALLPATTAAYSALDFDEPFDFTTPISPTLLTALPTSLPTGGAFFSKLTLGHGDIGPLNPVKEYNMLVDTGAQTSIISRGVAAELNLDLRNPAFTVDVAGIGGLTEDVPGFYVDYARMNAAGGPLQYTQIPFLVLDIPNPDGAGTLPGVMGMNFFWNRNVVFDPLLSGTSFLQIGEPLYGPEVFAGDFDFDLDRDSLDINDLFKKRGGSLEEADPAIYDLNRDSQVDNDDVNYWVRDLMSTRPGDTNLDGQVDIRDFAALRVNFGTLAEPSWEKGDFDGNSAVNVADFAQIRSNFGFRASQAVPEPASLLVMAMTSGFLFSLRRRTVV